MGIREEQRLKKTLAEWVFTPCRCRKCLGKDKRINFRSDPFYKLSDGQEMQAPDFPKDLNALFRWVIPKLRLELSDYVFLNMLEDWLDEYVLHSPPSEPALWLCRAVVQYLDTKKEVTDERD